MVAKVAMPPAIVPVPSVVEPSLKVTVPVMVPAVAEETVALKVTDCPAVEGFTEEDSAVLVVAGVVPPATT